MSRDVLAEIAARRERKVVSVVFSRGDAQNPLLFTSRTAALGWLDGYCAAYHRHMPGVGPWEATAKTPLARVRRFCSANAVRVSIISSTLNPSPGHDATVQTVLRLGGE